jgi:two-component system response regulator YesN
MLKVIIADDEERVCRLVQMIVDWDALGMKVIGSASNGFEALELVEKFNPDILITDIRMPGCDGIELIEKAKAISPHLQIALISGYAQFEYAISAINFDVGGYILKPIKKEIITATLEKLGSKCRDHASTVNIAKHIMHDGQKSSEILHSRLMEDLLSARIHDPSGELLERQYGFVTVDGLLQVIIIKIDSSFALTGDPSMSIVKKKIEELFESTLSEMCENFLFHFNKSAGYGILNFKAENQAKIRRTLRECLNQTEVYKFSGMEFSMAIGKAVDRAEKLPDSMQDAQIAIKERLIEGTGRILEGGQIKQQQGSAKQHPGFKKLVEKYVRTAERAADMLSPEEANRAVDEMSKETQNNGLNGYAILELVLVTGKMFALRLNMDESVAMINTFEEQCELCGSVGKLFSYLRSFMNEQITSVKEKLESDAIRPIRIAQQYIMEHFNEPITLEDVCATIGFSTSYFSRMFKNATGEGFSKYITRIRIEKAKELFRDTNFPVAEVCEMVGYSDIKHFTATFKKMTSLNPGQYRKLYG